MFNSVEGSFTLSEVADLIERLTKESLTPVAEGRIYVEWTRRINSSTGKRFTLQEVAQSTGRPYGQVRNRAALVRPYDRNAQVPCERIGDVDLSQVAVATLLRRHNTLHQGPTMQVLAIGIDYGRGVVWSWPVKRNSIAEDVAKKLRAVGQTGDVDAILIVENGEEGIAPPEVTRHWTAEKNYR